jgi:hypothetical protein
MSRTLLAAVVAGLAVLAVGPDHGPSYAQERNGRLLHIDFLALDADGTLVPDLAPADVDLRIDGRRRVVTSVRRVAAAPASASGGSRSMLDPPYGTSADSASGRTFLIVLDEDSFRTGREQPFRNGVIGLLDSLGTTDFVSVLGMPYGGVKVPLTNDHTRARHAIELAAGHRAVDETGSQMACRTRLLLESLEVLLQQLGARTSPVTVVLLTAGLAAPRRDAPMALAAGMCELQADLFRRVGVAAGQARANFYIAQPDDLGGRAGLGTESIAGVGFIGSDNPLAGIEDLAGVTRGVRLPLTAQGTTALDRIVSETAAYYLAEFEPELADFDPRSRRVDLRVTRPGVTVRARPEITFTRPRTVGAAERVTVSDMLMSTATFSDLPMRGAAYTLGPEGDGVRVALVAEPESMAVSLASAGAVLVNDDGAVVARWSAVDAGEIPLMAVMTVPPGGYRLRVAAVDAAGRGGAADYRFEARLTPVGPLQIGDLVLGLSRDGKLLPRLEFAGEPSALASFEMSGASEGMGVTALLEIAATPTGPALVTVPLAIQAQGGGRYLAIGTVPLGALAPGDYAVRGMLRLAGGPEGRTVRTLRKVR